MAHISGEDRSQLLLLPAAVDDYVGPDNPVRFIDAFVEGLDLVEAGFERVRPKRTGRPGYDPADQLKLYIYGYLNRIRSSRRLEAETHRNLEVLWLLRRLQPDFKTIADFRRDNRDAFRKVFRDFVRLCRELDLYGRELVAVDRTRIKGVNNPGRNFTRAKLERELKKADERPDRYLSQMDEADADDPGASAAAPDLQGKIAAIQKRRATLKAHRETLEESGRARESRGREDRRRGRQGVLQDRRHRSLRGGRVTPHVPKPVRSPSKGKGLFTKSRFRYDGATDTYACPGGHRLVPTYFHDLPAGFGSNTPTAMLVEAALSGRARTTDTRRRISRYANEIIMDRMAERLAAQPALLDRRRESAEHPFGSIKQWMGQGTFLTRGLSNVRGEFSLTALAYNMRRAINLIGVPALIAAATA